MINQKKSRKCACLISRIPLGFRRRALIAQSGTGTGEKSTGIETKMATHKEGAMKHSSNESVLTTAILGGCLAFGLAGPVAADSNLEIENDGLTLAAFASSSEDVLSTKIRVVGPDGFVFEDRVEDSAIQWIPEGELADGLYHWEAWTVTVEKGAPAREISAPQPASAAVQNQPAGATAGASDEFSNPETLEQQPSIPLERRFSDEFKQVHRESGSFRVRNGWMESFVDPDEDITRSEVPQPGPFGTIAGAVVDFVFPSAHADTFTSDITIDKANPRINFDDNRDTVRMQLLGNPNGLFLREYDNGTFVNTSVSIHQGAPGDSLEILSNGNMGLGTASPTEDLHISDPAPRIRIEDSTDGQSWYVKNSNAGRFEIGEDDKMSGVFVIQGGGGLNNLSSIEIASNGNVGFGTATPAGKLHTRTVDELLSSASPDIVMTHIFDGGSFTTTRTFSMDHGTSGLFFKNHGGDRIASFQHSAPANSLVVRDTGVGLGTSNPETPLHVLTNEGADNNMVLLSNDGGSRIYFRNRTAPESGNDSRSWVFSTTEPGFRVSRTFSGTTELALDNAGNLSIAGTLSQGSSRAIKNNIEPLSGAMVLANLSKLEFNEWSYDQAPGQRHAGPMAEDFFDTFGLGPDSKHIAPGDMAGLSLAAVKALYEENQQLKERLGRIEQAMLRNSNF